MMFSIATFASNQPRKANVRFSTAVKAISVAKGGSKKQGPSTKKLRSK
jgi:hypothetical protein